jgi:hypothetical protein
MGAPTGMRVAVPQEIVEPLFDLRTRQLFGPLPESREQLLAAFRADSDEAEVTVRAFTASIEKTCKARSPFSNAPLN